MIPRHEARFADLTPGQASRLSVTLGFTDQNDDLIAGTDLYEMCKSSGLTHAEVIMALASSPDPEAVLIVETLMGRPIDVRRRGESAYDPVTGRLIDPSAPRPAPRSSAARPRTDSRVVTAVAPNPKKPGSATHSRYAGWVVGDTVSACMARGLTSADVAYDIDRGFVQVRAGSET